MKTNLSNRIAHTTLPKSNGLLPLYEAVVNAIHAIDEANIDSEAGFINIEIIRENDLQPELVGTVKRGREAEASIVGFTVSDNGIGFNDQNMKSFETLDSDYKADLGCFGIGRLMWLKAFDSVKVESTYKNESSELKSRGFIFNAKGGVKESTSNEKIEKQPGSVVKLEGFKAKYRDATRKTVEGIARGLFEHCLWYFLRPGGAPRIVIHDSEDTMNMDAVLEDSMHSSASNDVFEVKGENFEITHIRLKASASKSHYMIYCAASRLVREESIKNRVPGLHGHLVDDEGDFIYAGYITSEFLDKHVRSERFAFDLPEKHEGIFEESEISISDIRNEALLKVSTYLDEYISHGKELSKERIDSFVSESAPRYKPLLTRIEESNITVDPDISDKDLELVLHKELYKIEKDVLSEGHDILTSVVNDDAWPDYKTRLADYLSKVSEIKKSDLAGYVSHRRVIIDLLEKSLQRTAEGKYSREDLVHELIFPMQVHSGDVSMDEFNLWLIDERLAFHDYLASDKTLNSAPITDNTENKEPDILALNVYDNPLLTSEGAKVPLASITVIELKRPMRNDAKAGEEKDPIEQSLGYLERIRNGNVTTKSGRPIPNSPEIPGFCYILCDLTPTIERRCKMHNLQVTSDKMGYFGYNDNFKSYIEVISFDRLVNAAKERNRAFFDKLGLPS